MFVCVCVFLERKRIEKNILIVIHSIERNENESEKQHYNGIWLETGKFVCFAFLFKFFVQLLKSWFRYELILFSARWR